MDDRYRLDGKVAVVTGCASGVGESVAKLFTERGSKVLAVDVNADGLESAMQGIENVVTMAQDVTDSNAAEEIIDAAIPVGPRPLVNSFSCAGLVSSCAFASTSASRPKPEQNLEI